MVLTDDDNILSSWFFIAFMSLVRTVCFVIFVLLNITLLTSVHLSTGIPFANIPPLIIKVFVGFVLNFV